MARGLLPLLTLLIISFGCVAGGPHLSINRDPGTTGVPTGSFEEIPVLRQNIELTGSGATLAQSEKFKTYGSVGFRFGGRTEGNLYKTTNPELSVGQRKMDKEE